MQRQRLQSETNRFRVCTFRPAQHALEQLFDDGVWYQRGPFFETKREVENYGRQLIGDDAEPMPPIKRDFNGKEIES